VTGRNLLAFLELEQIDRDLFRADPGVWPSDRTRLYGGEVAAQALRAAAATIATDRQPHSLHGYFLRKGDPTLPVVFVVDRDRDGRSFSARRVKAMQRGEVIWEMTCSFHDTEEGPQYTQALREGIAAPGDSPAVVEQWCPLVEIRLPPPPDGSPVRPNSVNRVWARVVVSVPDDPILHACLLAFTSDISSGFGELDIGGIPYGGPSIDHAIWFHHASRADDWVLYDCTPAKVGGHRGLYTGTAHDLDGRLVAMIAQEMLLRPLPGA
jgi:acyl-CoA thioesterase-2